MVSNDPAVPYDHRSRRQDAEVPGRCRGYLRAGLLSPGITPDTVVIMAGGESTPQDSIMEEEVVVIVLTGPTGLTYHRTSPLLPGDHHIVNPEQVDCRLCRALEGLSPGPVRLEDHLTEHIDNLPVVDVEAVMLLPFAGRFSGPPDCRPG